MVLEALLRGPDEVAAELFLRRRSGDWSEADARELGWWRDLDTGLSFSEASLMYAWQIEGEAGADGATAGAHRG